MCPYVASALNLSEQPTSKGVYCQKKNPIRPLFCSARLLSQVSKEEASHLGSYLPLLPSHDPFLLSEAICLILVPQCQ